MLIYESKPIREVQVTKFKTFSPPKKFLIKSLVWIEKVIVCINKTDTGYIAVDVNGDTHTKVFEFLNWSLSTLSDYLKDCDDSFVHDGLTIMNEHGKVIANYSGVLGSDKDVMSTIPYQDLYPAIIDSHIEYWKEYGSKDKSAEEVSSETKNSSVAAKIKEFPATSEKCEAPMQSLSAWNKRYLVCWEAFYAYSTTKMDAIVSYDFTNKDLCDFKKEILLPITKECAGGKDKFEAGITVTSLCEV